ncbi:MAG: outer membrane beta-barrel protein, partial [Deltaproteobacteria bacterium]|nr:outer membrane beta-barrel protein [Deltaproteobacteria bacterium]
DTKEFGAGFQMRLLPKTWAFFRYYFGERDYFTHPAGTGVNGANDSDFGWNRVNFGLTWESGAKLEGELNLGYQFMDYENTVDVEGDRYDDKDTWIAATSITYTATPTLGLALRLTRALRETGSGDNEYFEDTGIGINIKKVIQPKFTLTVGGVYSVNDYNIPREDDIYRFDAGLDYQIRERLTAGVDYRYKKQDSNYSENDYTDTQLIISFNAVY